jgi:hypothetical protein
MWFGTGAGASRFDGSSFQNYKMSATSANSSDSVHQSVYLQQLPKESWMHNDVNGIIIDKTGKLWFATRGFNFIYAFFLVVIPQVITDYTQFFL